MNKGKRPFGKILMILMILFFYLPIGYMIIFSFNDGKSLTSFTGFSLRWVPAHAGIPGYDGSVVYHVSIAILATFISTVVGTISAIGLSKSKKVIRNVMDQVTTCP